MAAPARTTQSLALVAADGAAASARVTQSLVLVAGDGAQAARVTQALALVACDGNQNARVTQSLVLLASEGPEASAVNVTQSVVLVAAPSPAPSRATQANVLLACDRDTTGPRVTQSLVLVASEDAAVAVEGPRITQGTVLVASEGTASPRVTQALVLLASGPSCPDTREGIRSFGLRELTDRVLECLGEQTSAPTYWTRAEIGRYLNDAAREFVRRTKVLEAVYSATTAIGTAEYTLPAVTMQVGKVFLDGVSLPNVTKWERDRTHGDWEGQSNKISAYITSQQNQRTIMLDQEPTEAEALSVWTKIRPTDMTDACDDAGTPNWSHQALVFMAAARALGKGGEQRNDALAAAYAGMAEPYIALQAGLVGHRSGER